MAIYGYVRVSTTNQADNGESLDVQRRQLEGWAMMAGQPLTKLYEERGVSGSTAIKDRPEGGVMWSKLRAGDTVVAAKLDRMFRSSLDALNMVEELKVKQVSLVLLDLGADAITNGLSKLFLTIAAAFAEAERDKIRERVSQTKADQRQRGRYLGGKLPFGFRRGAEGDLEPVEGEQEIIAGVRALSAGGASLRLIQSSVESRWKRRLSLDALSRIVREGQG